jgi:hypothetical protein
MRIKTLYTIRSSANSSGEMAVVMASILDPQVVWVRSMMTEAKIQDLVNCGLLRPKVEVEWRAAAGEQFLTEDVKEQVVFASFFEGIFNHPVGDFFRGLCTTTSWSWYILFPTPLL